MLIGAAADLHHGAGEDHPGGIHYLRHRQGSDLRDPRKGEQSQQWNHHPPSVERYADMHDHTCLRSLID